ncbi:MAG: sigma-70 family RNA polymerase sigma factor [Planctomycetota bacterium]
MAASKLPNFNEGTRVITDLELVDRVRAGDIQAYEQLAERYERSVLAIAQAELRDPQVAQEVTEAVLLQGYRALENLVDGSGFGPWLLKLARRQSIEAVRTMPIPVGADGPGLSDGELDCCDLEWIEHEMLLGLIARLPPDERRLIGLRYFDNHPMPTIAAITGTPVERLEEQISRTVTRLNLRWQREQE